MQCVSCHEEEVLNRIVVNHRSRQKHGLFCQDCESNLFGKLLDNPTWHQQHGCAFCDGDGRFALPAVDCIIEDNSGAIQQIEYEDLNRAVCLCFQHVEELLHEETTIRQRVGG